ncbi:MAG: isoleucine--tRNA ligase [Clostridia bacterium]|nr:isoleucine--tRNA ligase [Clostridia bacterium]
MLYKKVSTSLNFVEREKEILKFWKENDIFNKSIENREGCEVYTFYDGPPTANGKPHIGHVETRAFKDLVPRYFTMKGRKVLRKAGWDTHGLPVELEVEKALGLDGKPQIEAYGVEPFIHKCKESVWKYKGEWEELSDRVGFWADMENPYVTYDDNYIESVWWSLKTIADKDLLYKGFKVVPYCPRCGTALSSHEVAQGYADVKEKSAMVRFKVSGQENTYIIAWTTTPWTLPSNQALCVNPDSEYSKVKAEDGNIYIAATALIGDIIDGEVKTLEKYKGKDLQGMEYDQLFPKAGAVPNGQKCKVVCDNYVTLSDGSGIVHLAPFGDDDARILLREGLEFIQIVNEQGEFIETTPWPNTFVKDADKSILVELEERGQLHKAENYEHSYPFCWRCDTPLLYYPRHSWFIKVSVLKDELIKNNRSVNWIPDTIKEGRMGNWLENLIDWGVSRERYWGTPLPVWTCDCGHMEVIGSREQLIKKGENVKEDIELHKPFIDEVKIKCEKCGKMMDREDAVIDCWYDSGSMPFAQWHYPFENQEIFNENFPADFISEAVDQTRGWFYTLLAISTLLFDKAPFKNCLVLGHVCDMDGKKMSKHLGNVVDPWDVLNVQGADAVRWYFYASSSPWLPTRFSGEAVSEGQRKFMGTLWNTYAFYVLYANIDGFNPLDYKLEYDKLSVMDKWALSKLNTLIKTVDDCLSEYKITESARAMTAFVDDLSNWYVRRGRERYWGSEMTQDKINAYMTLYTCLTEMAKLSAPFTPFMAESMYQNLVHGIDSSAPVSVHMSDFPVYNAEYVDEELEENMAAVLSAVTLGRACRNVANIKNRQPASRLFVQGVNLPDSYKELVADELNVKEVIMTENASDFVDYIIKPQMRTLGPKYGKILPQIKEALLEVDGSSFVSRINADGAIKITVAGQEIELALDDVLIETTQKEGYISQMEYGVTVVLDTNLTPELLEEGFVREIISKVQTMRKDAGFEVTDHIKLGYQGAEDIMSRNAEFIGSETLSDEVINEQLEGFTKEWNISDTTVKLTVKKIQMIIKA